MNLIKDARFALKISVDLQLSTPLLLRSGLTGDITDSTIERTFDDRLFVNGYVWASLLRRSLARLADGNELADQVGKYQEEGGVSPLWCEQSVADLHGTSVNPGISIDRKWGATKSGALFNDELAIAGLPLTLRCTLFAPDAATAETWRTALLDALRLVHEGVENIGGGWTYGYGRLAVDDVRFAILDLKDAAARKLLWQWDKIVWDKATIPGKLPKTTAPVTCIHVRARVADGQIMAIKSSVFPLDAPTFGKLPDSFVFRRNRLVNGESVQEPVIPGKALRQALLSVPLERKWRSQGEKVCFPNTDKNSCKCLRCRWLGSTDAAGIVAVTDAPVVNPSFKVVSRVQLCEHSMQNMNLFSGEYLTGGEFSFKVIIDGSRAEDAASLTADVSALLEEMKGEKAPPGWYRLGGTSTCTGQVQVIDYNMPRSEQP